jgi:dTMP kinase
MTSSGTFITFEGGEGAGKTTQVNALAEMLTNQGYKAITTREPGGTAEAEKIRDLIVQRESGNWTPMAECLLIFAARVMHVSKVIAPALSEGKIVICDRFTDSTRAYQGYGRGMGLEIIETLQSLTINDLEPDITFVMDIDAKAGLERSSRRLAAESLGIKQSEDRFENMDMSFHEALRNGFLEIAKASPDRCRIIDATQDSEVIAEKVLNAVTEALK